MNDEGDTRYWLPPFENGKPQVLTRARKKRKDVVRVEGERGGVEYRSVAEPLEFYVARGYISGEQYQAGVRFYALWKGSILNGRYATARYGVSESGYDPERMALMPRDYLRAAAAIRGAREQRTVWAVCCFGEPAGRAMTRLKSGLDDLAKHFRY